MTEILCLHCVIMYEEMCIYCKICIGVIEQYPLAGSFWFFLSLHINTLLVLLQEFDTCMFLRGFAFLILLSVTCKKCITYIVHTYMYVFYATLNL